MPSLILWHNGRSRSKKAEGCEDGAEKQLKVEKGVPSWGGTKEEGERKRERKKRDFCLQIIIACQRGKRGFRCFFAN